MLILIYGEKNGEKKLLVSLDSAREINPSIGHYKREGYSNFSIITKDETIQQNKGGDYVA